MKRPDYAPPLAEVATPNAVVTKGHRFDIYARYAGVILRRGGISRIAAQRALSGLPNCRPAQRSASREPQYLNKRRQRGSAILNGYSALAGVLIIRFSHGTISAITTVTPSVTRPILLNTLV
ncbi:putative methyltransferase [Klebsiella variicola]|nr:putative methyltransferase [Klebsiella variicola]